MRYFDFHAHIVLKQLFAEQPNIDTTIRPNEVKPLPNICSDLPNILQSQIHQTQLASFEDEVMVGVALYGMESRLAEQVIPLRKLFKNSSQFKVWLPLFEAMSNSNPAPGEKIYETFDKFTVERSLLKYTQAPLSFNVLNKESFKQPLPKDKVNIFFVIEGCHSLVNSANEAPTNDPAKKYPPKEILENIDYLLQQNISILSVNLTHLQQSNLCNHAFGMQLAENEPFYPTGNGLTTDGHEVVQGLFDKNINIDVKHMSYKSRRDLYAAIDAGNFNTPRHINCTHAGFTGVSFNDWPRYILLKKPLKDVHYIELVKSFQVNNGAGMPGAPAFNMSSINLFNEEIEWIVKHGGMIGLSMDRRIIGYVDLNDNAPTSIDPDFSYMVDKEYLSKTEWAALGLPDNIDEDSINNFDSVEEKDVKASTENIAIRNEYFFDHVLLQLKHFLQVCVDAGIPLKEAQKHITIGSDFDGMINPFFTVDTVEEMPTLKKYIQRNFMFYLKSLNDSSKWAKKLNVDEFVEDLFYNNGYNYIKNYFSA